MFEVVLSTMESKLRRVENLDRAVQQLMRKMNSLEARIDSKTANITREIDRLANQLESKMSAVGSSESLMANINSRLDQLSIKMDEKNVDEEEEEDVFEAQPSNHWTRIYRFPGVQMVKPKPLRNGRRLKVVDKVTSAMDEMRNMVDGIDRRLGFHINLVSENLGKMTNMVKEVCSFKRELEPKTNISQNFRFMMPSWKEKKGKEILKKFLWVQPQKTSSQQ